MGRCGLRGTKRGVRVAIRRAALLTVLACGLCAGASATASAASPTINHVFVIVLENESYNSTFGTSPGSQYLAKTLPADGALLQRYYGIGHQSLDNYIAMISGQPPNVDTQADCQFFNNMFPGTIGADGIVMGQGCVYPAATQTVANQLDSDGLSWRAYAEDMANSVSAGQPASCRHPNINAQDSTQSAKARRPVRRPPRALRLLPLDHRHGGLRKGRRRPRAAPGRPQTGGRDAELLVHHPRPLRRRARRELPGRLARRLCRHRPLPSGVGAADHGLARLPGPRAAADHLRRGRQ